MTEKLPIILYLDDEESNLAAVTADLEEKFQVVGFSNSSQALKEIAILKPHIVLSDLKMPEMTGVEFLELVQKVYPEAVRVIITGNADDQASVIAAIKRARVSDFLKKPFKESEVEDSMLKAYDTYLKQDSERRKKEKLINPDLMEHPSWLHKISNQIREAFRGLPQYSVDDKQIENWSLLVHLAMSAEKRYYHNTEHLFDISNGASSYERLAILFHDTVYAQVDAKSLTGMLPQVIELISPLIPTPELTLTLPAIESFSDADEYRVLYQVFGKQPGDILNISNGMNEFLSARIAQKALGSVLTPWDLIKVMACIELTIPFRPKDKEGLSASERLLNRVRSLNKDLRLGNADHELIRTVERAVDVTNRDLWSFGATDPGDFLNGSWKLILEGNTPLQRELHAPKDYRIALGKMEGFLNFLKPDIIFQRIKNYPKDKAYAQLISQCHYNLDAARIYFRAKILSMSILEALDDLTGGNAPVEAFRGDIESASNLDTRMLEHRLNMNIPVVSAKETNEIVIELLKSKTETKLHYDFKNSPLALYLYTRLNNEEFKRSIHMANRYFKAEIKALEFLKVFPKPVICAILQATSEIANSRQTEILQYKALLEKS